MYIRNTKQSDSGERKRNAFEQAYSEKVVFRSSQQSRKFYLELPMFAGAINLSCSNLVCFCTTRV